MTSTAPIVSMSKFLANSGMTDAQIKAVNQAVMNEILKRLDFGNHPFKNDNNFVEFLLNKVQVSQVGERLKRALPNNKFEEVVCLHLTYLGKPLNVNVEFNSALMSVKVNMISDLSTIIDFEKAVLSSQSSNLYYSLTEYKTAHAATKAIETLQEQSQDQSQEQGESLPHMLLQSFLLEDARVRSLFFTQAFSDASSHSEFSRNYSR